MRWLVLLLLVAAMLMGCEQTNESKEIKVVTMSPRDMVEQLKLGEIDAFVAWEPFVSEAVEKGYGKIIATSKDIWPNHPCCVVATVSDDEELMTALVWAHVKATRFINDERNREKVIKYAMEFTGKSKEEIEAAMSRIKFVEFPDEEEFVKYYEGLKEGGYLKKTAKDLGFSSEDEFLSNFLYKDIYSFVVSKLSSNESWKPKMVNKTVRIGYLTADLHQLAFYVAVKEGYYEEVGLKVEAKEFANGVMEMEGFKNGEIDAGYLGGAPATLKRVNDDVKIRIIAGANSEGSAIVARSANSIKELAGKKVAIPGFGTVQDFLLRIAAGKAGLKITT